MLVEAAKAAENHRLSPAFAAEGLGLHPGGPRMIGGSLGTGPARIPAGGSSSGLGQGLPPQVWNLMSPPPGGCHLRDVKN